MVSINLETYLISVTKENLKVFKLLTLDTKASLLKKSHLVCILLVSYYEQFEILHCSESISKK